jgi:hypothetical protein
MPLFDFESNANAKHGNSLILDPAMGTPTGDHGDNDN